MLGIPAHGVDKDIGNGLPEAHNRLRALLDEINLLPPEVEAARASEASQAWTGNILTWLQEWTDEHCLDLGPDTNEPL